ncbi:MAG: hypothetical protein HQL29_02035 [Candidatus Omnitrophica bacterium]|nr:hypothetical protein [Candidatus Omnitrophota bacterium]
MNKNGRIDNILGNVALTKSYILNSNNVKNIVLVSGTEMERVFWMNRFKASSKLLFNKNNSTNIFSFEEKIGNKCRQGNFLGTLLAYNFFKKEAVRNGIKYEDTTAIFGMIFGSGKRLSPFTQILRNCKPSISAACGTMEIEESLMYIAPLVKYLEKGGFKGVLDKWGDETQIASVSLDITKLSGCEFQDFDIIKFVEKSEVNEHKAMYYDWVVCDGDDNLAAMVSRVPGSVADRGGCAGVLRNERDRVLADVRGGSFGVSLGPVAVSYRLLEVFCEVFHDEILKEGIILDFDPYLLMALTFKGNKKEWEKVSRDCSVPGLFEKAENVKKIYTEKYGKEPAIKVFDLGKDIFWMDMGNHTNMRKKYMLLNENTPEGDIARSIEGIGSQRDDRGNIIINSFIFDGTYLEGSIVIDSKVTGSGKIKNSVIKNSSFKDVDFNGAFAIDSHRSGHTELAEGAGLYFSFGGNSDDLVLEEGMRQGTLLTENGPVDMMVSEKIDLKDKNNYEKKILNNTISFKEASFLMENVDDEIMKMRIKKFKERNQ